MSDFSEQLKASILKGIQIAEEKGLDLDEVVEDLNRKMFAVSMTRGIDGWMKVSINHETKTISIDVEGWSQDKRRNIMGAEAEEIETTEEESESSDEEE